MNPHGGLFISVSASPLSQRRERSAGRPPPFMMAFNQFQRSRAVYENVRWTFESEQGCQRLRPLPTTGAHRLRLRRSRALRIAYIPPETACPPATQIRCSSESPALPEKPSPSRSKSVPERRAELPILIRDCTRQAVSRLSFGLEV